MQSIQDIVEPNGKTIKENNLEINHNIPVGALVEVKFSDWFGEGAGEIVHARLWVVSHDRDCDGTPLYSISRWKHMKFASQVHQVRSGFSEESLTPIKLTKSALDGDDYFGELISERE